MSMCKVKLQVHIQMLCLHPATSARELLSAFVTNSNPTATLQKGFNAIDDTSKYVGTAY